MALRFRQETVPGIHEGKVTMQFGLWRRPRVVAGRVYVVPNVGVVRVTAVEKVDLARLTSWEAEAAGAEDVEQLREWLKEQSPDKDPMSGMGFRVRFRYLGSETNNVADASEVPEDEEDDGEEGARGATSAVSPKPVPPDLMGWVDKRPWRIEHLKALASGVWRNADDISPDVGADSPTTRRRMGDLRKRGLVTSHRHHGYRITPEGQGALARQVEEGVPGEAGGMAGWLRGKPDRVVVINALGDGQWHNAAEVAGVMGLSVVSVQRRVAALRDRGLIESHRRRGYRLTEAGREALSLNGPGGAPGGVTEAQESGKAVVHPGELEAPPTSEGEGPTSTAAVPSGDLRVTAGSLTVEAKEEPAAPVSASLLEWLTKKPYRKDILLSMSEERYRSSGELSEELSTSVTALHGRLKTLKERGLVEALPRRGYRHTLLGVQATKILQAMEMKTRGEPTGADAFLRAEPMGWSTGAPPARDTAPGEAQTGMPGSATRWGSGSRCGFCHATTTTTPALGWVKDLQMHLEAPSDKGTKSKPIPCNRGVFEDSYWFMVVERDPLAEGHCKLVCKEHIWDLIELADWAQRDQRLAAVRDSLARDLLLGVEVVATLDPRIVDVLVLNGLEHGSHLHFDLIPRYRMDLPGMRPLASIRANYDDLSLVRKRRLWSERKAHLEEIAGRFRGAADRLIRTRGISHVRLIEE